MPAEAPSRVVQSSTRAGGLGLNSVHWAAQTAVRATPAWAKRSTARHSLEVRFSALVASACSVLAAAPIRAESAVYPIFNMDMALANRAQGAPLESVAARAEPPVLVRWDSREARLVVRQCR